MPTALIWFRRDLRLDDHPALQSALRAGYRIVPVYVHAPEEEAPWSPGAASLAWLRRSLAALDTALRGCGSRLIVRAGPSLAMLEQLVDETNAEAVYWSRRYEPACIARDATVKHALRARRILVETHNSALLCEPWTVATRQGDPYRMFTPFWRNASAHLDVQNLKAAPECLPSVDGSIVSADMNALIPAPTPTWDMEFWAHWQPGEQGAHARLAQSMHSLLQAYLRQRDRPDVDGTSRLSPHLHFGEISPRRIMQTLQSASNDAYSTANSDGYVRELGWREFSHHLLYHFPHTTEANLNARFNGFGWADAEPALLAAWQQGRTGIPMVDAGMRQLWRTGWMHNRVRMVVASFLTKNLRMHWLRGARWFWDTLLDADLASNTQGWQWSAGTGADAAPYFRVFNPVSQTLKFDPDGSYVRRWVQELQSLPAHALLEPWKHPELLARCAPDYPRSPIVDLKLSRAAALAAYASSKPDMFQR
ncbi:MAG TPA: deoxyribodipyrimidine photo-lyase [Xanthomonadaceae bacterium]|nr:deoxyribodipyrimidine photo-lyase [Xanthomonadaceae bacterium]